MASRLQRFTESIGLKVTKEQLQYFQTLADQQQKPLAEWCREVLLASTKRPTATLFEQALMAEMAAIENITVTLIYETAGGRDLSRDRVQQVHDGFHARKYKDAEERLKRALSRTVGNCPPLSNPPSERGGRA